MFGKMLTFLGFALARRASNGTFCERASGTYGNTKLAPCPRAAGRCENKDQGCDKGARDRRHRCSVRTSEKIRFSSLVALATLTSYATERPLFKFGETDSFLRLVSRELYDRTQRLGFGIPFQPAQPEMVDLPVRSSPFSNDFFGMAQLGKAS